jgi:16S rRNA (cytosine1402-N4)-methyltransferase
MVMQDVQLALPGVLAETHIEWVWTSEDEIDVDDFAHATVMRDEVVGALAPHAGGVYLDVTLGGGGHTEAILEADEGARVIAFDKDARAIEAAGQRCERFGDRVRIVRTSFGAARAALASLGVVRVHGICADLGVSSPQLDDPQRGMSFRREGPIDMRMDPDDGETALELIERTDDEELANIIYRFGDERRSRRIARSIHRALQDHDLNSTLDLRRAIVRAVGPARVGGVDPATRTFQALRIAVNKELEELDALIADLPEILEPGGVAALMSFHSLEDRAVKRAFADKTVWEPLWKKPRMATDDEAQSNPRARSAKLRAARRVLHDEESSP